MTFIDSHSHIDFTAFDFDRSNAIDRAKNVGVKKIIVSATVASRWHLIKELGDSNPDIAIAYGLHPMFMNKHHDEHLRLLKTWLETALETKIETNKPVALGEIGLDYFIPNPDRKAQLNLFVQQLEIASELKLPVIIHARKSLDLIFKELRRFPQLTGSIHCFSGSKQQANIAIDLGFYLGFGGPITYTRATKLRKLVSTLPLESIILETDSPDQPDSTHRGERNEPAYLPIIAQEIATLRRMDVRKVAEHIFTNTKQLFNL